MTVSQTHAPLEVRIDLAGCDDKTALLARFASALKFPSWFGSNWDALADCLTDLSWLPAPAYRIFLLQPGQLRQADPEVLATSLEILDEAAAYWADEGVAFTVELIEDGDPLTTDLKPDDAPQ